MARKPIRLEDVFDALPAFVRAVDAGSFALAAERAGVTRSAVAKQVAKLESRLGLRLFQRTTRRQRLTEAGEMLYERARRAVAEMAAAAGELEAGLREPAGHLRVTAPALMGRVLVAPVLAQLTRLHPKLDVEFAFEDRIVDLVDEGVDLAIRIGPLRDTTNLVARPLGRQRFAIYASPAYLRRAGRPRTPADFAGHAAIVYARGGTFGGWSIGSGRDAIPLAVAPRLRFDDVAAIADGALAGAGLARLPGWLAAPHVAAGRLVSVLDEGQGEDEVHVVWSAAPRLPLKTRVAIDALVAKLPRALDPAPRHVAKKSRGQSPP